MMNLQTKIAIRPLEPQIKRKSKLLLLGSCFSTNVGDQLNYHGFDAMVNPFGVIFNPHSINKLVTRVVSGQRFSNADLVNVGSRFVSFDAHSVMAQQSSDMTLDLLNGAFERMGERIEEASHIFITLGSAWVYRLAGADQIVANCHKQDRKYFQKELLETRYIVNSLINSIAQINKANPKANVILTVSPVRHFRDGVVQNMQSKARLHDAIQQVVGKGIASYFPSYELVMDEMRDYRFFGRDLLHLNEFGIDYLWKRFRESAIDHNNTQEFVKKVTDYRKLAAHLPRRNSEQHHELVEEKKQEVLDKFPEANLD